MSLFPNRLDLLIDQLESAIPYVNEGFSFGFKIERQDWQPVWTLCQQIQAEFRGFKGYPTREAHQAAWQRFQDLRNRASQLANIEKEKFANQSARLKEDILDEAKSCYWSKSTDFLIGTFLGETTVEEMKELQARLKHAGQKLSENKTLMTRQDKEACFEAIKDARESHDRFWEKHKMLREERREATQRRREEFDRKRSEWIERTNANIAKNRENLGRAEDALERTRDRIRDLEDKVAESTSPKWEAIHSEWLDQARAKERDIEESIERIRGWIQEDLDKLNSA